MRWWCIYIYISDSEQRLHDDNESPFQNYSQQLRTSMWRNFGHDVALIPRTRSLPTEDTSGKEWHSNCLVQTFRNNWIQIYHDVLWCFRLFYNVLRCFRLKIRHVKQDLWRSDIQVAIACRFMFLHAWEWLHYLPHDNQDVNSDLDWWIVMTFSELLWISSPDGETTYTKHRNHLYNYTSPAPLACQWT